MCSSDLRGTNGYGGQSIIFRLFTAALTLVVQGSTGNRIQYYPKFQASSWYLGPHHPTDKGRVGGVGGDAASTVDRNPPANAGGTGSIPDLGRFHMLQGN